MLKGKTFWAIKPPSQCSWYWRKILRMRDKIRALLKHNSGNGCGTFLWFDNWHPLGPLLDKFGSRIVYDSALSLHAKVKEIITDREWHWPRTNTLDLMEVRAEMHSIALPSDSIDTVRWIPSPNGKFSTSHTWDYLRSSSPKVPWYRLIWFPGSFPRHSFIAWLAILNRLSTHDRIFKFTPGPLACVLCHQGMESHDHLFFNCSFSSYVWQGILQRLVISNPTSTWINLVEWAAASWKKKTPIHIISRMFFGSAVYHVWRERNARSFRQEAKSKERVLQDIFSQVSLQMQIKWKGDPHLPQYISQWG